MMNPADVLKYGHKTVLDTLKGITPEQMEIGNVCGVWSTRDIMAHLASYELYLDGVLGTFLGEPPTPTLIQIGELGGQRFNDIQVEMRKKGPVQSVLDEYIAATERNLSRVPLISAEVWRQVGTLPWYGNEYALDDFIVYSFYGHKREHSAQISVFKDTLK
jgi:DinB family protein